MSKLTTISNGTFPPPKLTRIDGLLRSDHSYLEPTDECYFLGEYTPRQGFSFSPTNDFVLNFKKRPGERGQQYKAAAIEIASKTFGNVINGDYLRQSVLVPVPPAKHRDDPKYDDRILRMVSGIVPKNGRPNELIVRELVVQKKSLQSAHESAARLKPEEIAAECHVNAKIIKSPPTSIAIFDDVVVTGARFKATQLLLLKKYAGVRIVGFFIARRVPDADASSF